VTNLARDESRSRLIEVNEMTAEIALRKPIGRKPVRGRKIYGRSRVSNGRDVLPDVDGRSVIARRYRDITSAILIDQGGADQCSESRTQLIRRFAAAVLAEQMESRLANGETIDIQQHATLSSTLVRLAQRIGIDRIAKDITPSLADIAAEIEAGHVEDVT
jgi:hypothetical protein